MSTSSYSILNMLSRSTIFSFIDELYVAASILFSMSESFMGIVIVVAFRYVWVLSCRIFASFLVFSILVFIIGVHRGGRI